MLPNDLLSSVVTLDEMIHSEAFENDCYNFQYKFILKKIESYLALYFYYKGLSSLLWIVNVCMIR